MDKHHLTVTGVGKAELIPDEIVITFTVNAKNTDYNCLNRECREKLDELTAALKEVGFEASELKTSSYRVNTEYENFQDENNTWKKRFIGYSINHMLSVKFDFDTKKLNVVINAVSSCKKADPAFNISFGVKDKAAASDRLLVSAVKDAAHKAEIIAQAASIELNEICEITYDSSEAEAACVTAFYKASAGELCRGADNNIDITPENINAMLNVKITWNFSKKSQ